MLTAADAADAASVRIKDIVNVQGVRGNDLVGYGLVVGLNGSGDSLRSIPFTEDSLVNLLERLGVNIEGEDVKAKNVAAVIVTATLPPFARSGSEIDATVSAIGDAKSLLGGTLVLTPLLAADGNVYAVAQGTVIAGGFEARGMRGIGDAGRADLGRDSIGCADRAGGRFRARRAAERSPRPARSRFHDRAAHPGRDQPRSRTGGRPDARFRHHRRRCARRVRKSRGGLHQRDREPSR